MTRGRKQIKCEGRFSEFRENLAEALELLVESDPLYRLIHPNDLNSILELVESDIGGYDPSDPYFANKRDSLRTDPAIIGKEDPFLKGIAIVPLITPDTEITRGLRVSDTLRFEYARQFVNEGTAHLLGLFSGDRSYDTEGVERLDLELKIKPENIVLPISRNGNGNGHNSKDYKTLAGYKLAAGFAVGPNSLGTLVYDAPYHIEVYTLDPKAPQRAERTAEAGVMGIGFWLNSNDEMLVAQMQAVRGSKLPEGVEMGIAGLAIAESVAKALGLSRITTYSHHTHPQFAMHPDSRAQMEGMFKRDYDHGAKVLGFTPLTRSDGTGNEMNIGYTKNIKQ